MDYGTTHIALDIYEGQTHTITFPTTPPIAGGYNHSVYRYTNFGSALAPDDYVYSSVNEFDPGPFGTSAKVTVKVDNVADAGETFQYVYDLSWQSGAGAQSNTQKWVWDITILEGTAQNGTSGNNTFIAAAGYHSINGFGGIDTVDYSLVPGPVNLDLAAHRADDGFGQVDTLYGIERIIGSDFADVLSGGGGNDRFVGRGGSDTVKGLGGADNLDGGPGKDTLVGGNGIDVLYGKGGNDRLTGSANADKYVFDTALGATTNKDTILDFAPAVDKLQLDDDIFTEFGQGGTRNVSPDNYRVGGAVDGNDYILYNSVTGVLTYDSNGSAAGGATVFAMLSTYPTLSAADFQLIA